jgi:hypothetical protein
MIIFQSDENTFWKEIMPLPMEIITGNYSRFPFLNIPVGSNNVKRPI